MKTRSDWDKFKELSRYERRAKSSLERQDNALGRTYGSESIPIVLRSPYIFYEESIANLVKPYHQLLEIGSGIGVHTFCLLKTGAQVTASDISPSSLRVLEQSLSSEGVNLATQVADMEDLPFQDNSFDVIASAGSLSYGDPSKVDHEILRVLKPNGIFICVDSLNHNPIYRINRWIHYLRGERTLSTLGRIPNLDRIKSIGENFEQVEIRFFGSTSWFMSIFSLFIRDEKTKELSDYLDKKIPYTWLKYLAFKFVIVAKNSRK